LLLTLLLALRQLSLEGNIAYGNSGGSNALDWGYHLAIGFNGIYERSYVDRGNFRSSEGKQNQMSRPINNKCFKIIRVFEKSIKKAEGPFIYERPDGALFSLYLHGMENHVFATQGAVIS